MKLKSLKIKNYRIHKELTIEFDNQLTLIGGSNESGKSTIAEAIHRVLFLKAKGNRDDLDQMKSLIHKGDPEVELMFMANGEEFTLHKIFGIKGQTQLMAQNKSTLTNDKAEEELTRILKTETKLTSTHCKIKWENLWIWQGTSMKNPIEIAKNKIDDLINGLRINGDAILIQSQKDILVATSIKNEKDSIYRNNDRQFKVDSRQETVKKDMERKKELYDKSKSILEDLEQAATQLNKTRDELSKKDKDILIVGRELNQKQESLKILTQLQNDESLTTQQLNQLETKLAQIKDANNEIHQKNEENTGLIRKEEEIKNSIKSIEELINQNESIINNLENNLANLSEIKNKNNTKYNYYQNMKILLVLEKEITRLNDEYNTFLGYKEDRNKFSQKLSSLPEVNQNIITELETLHNEISNINSAMQAIATSVEIMKSNQTVKVNSAVQQSEKFTFTEDTILEFGEEVKMKIIPGGGSSLANYKRNFKERKSELSKRLKDLSVENIENAKIILFERLQYQNQIKQLDDLINNVKHKTLEIDLANKKGEHERTKNMINRVGEEQNLNFEEEKNDIEIKLNVIQENINKITDEEQELKGRLGLLKIQLESNRNESNAKKETERGITSTIKSNESIIKHLTSRNGDDSVRTQGIIDLQIKIKDLENNLNSTKNRIIAYIPEQLLSEEERLKRTLEGFKERREDLISAKARLETILEGDMNTDPREEFRQYEKQYHAAKHEYEALEKEAKAILMLHDLFIESKTELSQTFTMPMAQKVKFYLDLIFNPSSEVIIRESNGVFKGLEIQRINIANGANFNYETLSGGTKEQVAAAFRLAMAEVLAAEYEGCLPIVFDDAFSYSDNNRIDGIQRMLYEAGKKRHLQIIVLSCNPDDYNKLGAKYVALN